MVVKDKIGRKRYVIIYNVKDLGLILKSISKKFKIDFQFIFKSGHYAVVRVKHWDKERFVSLLNDFNVPTLKVTGTIKKAKEIIKNRELGNNGSQSP
ncbi:MAG: hypothetical protein JHC29_02035 [Thermoplasmata archaeon]|jgi:hypothetical protein|nr:hypothetical protein [Thermoplasmata archaeon]